MSSSGLVGDITGHLSKFGGKEPELPGRGGLLNNRVSFCVRPWTGHGVANAMVSGSSASSAWSLARVAFSSVDVTTIVGIVMMVVWIL